MNELDEPPGRSAFDRLRSDAKKLDTLEPLHRVHVTQQSAPVRLIALGAFAAIAVIVGVVLMQPNDEDRSDVVAGEPDIPSDGVTIPDDVGESPGLSGTSWVLVSGSGPNGQIPIVEGWPITLTFQEGTLGGTAACNGYGGDYSLDGSTLSFGEIASNAMGCEPAIMKSEAAFHEALRVADTVEMTDRVLRLSGPGTELVFKAQVEVPVAELVGQLWLLETLSEGDTSTEASGDPATLLLDEDGNVRGSTGCRTFSGSYIVSGGSVLFPDFGMEGECPAQLAGQDGLVVNVLGDGFSARVDGDRLTLSSVGNEGLGYRAISEDDTTPMPLPESITLSTLLEDRPDGDVVVSAFLVDAGGGWFLCDQLDPMIFHRCSGRWIVLTDVPDDIAGQFGPNELSDDIGRWRSTEEPVPLLGRLTVDDRFELSGSEDAAVLRDGESSLLEALIDVDPNAPDIDALRLSPDGVIIALGNQLIEQRTRDQLSDPVQWRLDSEEFRGRVGPFSALDALAAATNTMTLAGPHAHCAAPPAPLAEQFRGARQLSVQPTGIDSCLDWWTVDLFLDAQGDVISVVFDTWEP